MLSPCNCIVGLGLLALCGLGTSANAQTPAIRWHGDLKQAADLSRTSGKPLFVVFRCVR